MTADRGDMPVTISIDRSLCVGSATCQHVAPEAFDLDENGLAVVLDPGAVSDDELELAARSCPTGAISLS